MLEAAVSAMLLTQVQPAAVYRVPGVQRTPEHITSLLLPRGLKRRSDQQPAKRLVTDYFEIKYSNEV